MSCHSRESIVPRMCDNRFTTVTQSTHSCDTTDSHLCDDLKVKDFYLFRQDIFWCLRQRQNYRLYAPPCALSRPNQPLLHLNQALFHPEPATIPPEPATIPPKPATIPPEPATIPPRIGVLFRDASRNTHLAARRQHPYSPHDERSRLR